MQIFSLVYPLAIFALLSTAFPVPVKRQSDLANQLISNIQTISEDLTALNTTLNSFPPDDVLGILTALKIQSQTSQVSTDLVTAAHTASQSSNFTSTESGDIGTSIIDLEPVIYSVLDNIVEHKPSFATAILFIGDISETVETDLEQQQTLSSEFSTAIAAKLAEPYSEYAPLIADEIYEGEFHSSSSSSPSSFHGCRAIFEE